MQLIKNIKWELHKMKMRAYLKRKHGGDMLNIYGVLLGANIERD